MGYSMKIESATVSVENDFFSPTLLESTTVFDDGIVSSKLHDISLNHFHLMRGRQSATKDTELFLNFETSFFVTHFALSNTVSYKQTSAKDQNTYSAYYQDKQKPELGFIGESQEYEFFELAFQKCFLQQLIEEDEPYSEKLHHQFNNPDYMSAVGYPILPAMSQCIHELNNTPFTGSLQKLYLETKTNELFLMQVQAMCNQSSKVTALKPRDIECLHEARVYIEKNYHTPCTIIDLAKIVGINQTKLKSGFKELFGTTVFGYVKDLQMEKARQLLLCEKLFVGEVADQIGYKYPQHFAAAFKRRFGILPSELKL
ncbi:MAG: AraC family transcriptional regulator [Chitinophagaceae bacterium]|nr:MAG: AraC family transcriptional regulator [Chitinophagaceae bacterium]